MDLLWILEPESSISASIFGVGSFIDVRGNFLDKPNRYPHTFADLNEWITSENELRLLYIFFQTHISENREEIAFVREIFPEAKNYADVYEQAGLLGEKVYPNYSSKIKFGLSVKIH